MIRLLLAVLLLTATPLAFAQPTGTLSTPQLDADADGDGLPDGWRRYVSFPGKADLAVDPAVKLDGNTSLRITLADRSRCAVTQWLTVAAGSAYTFSFRARGEAAAAVPVQARIQWFRTVDWPRHVALVRDEPPSPPVTVGEAWTEVAATGTRPENADLAVVALIAGNGASPGGSVWLTGASLREGAFPAPLISNPGFELDLNADGQPDGWGKAAYGEGFDLARDETVAHSGQASIRLTGAPDHGDRSCYTQATGVFTPPSKVRLSFWYKGTGLSHGIMHLLTPAGVKRPDGRIDYGVMTFTPELSNDWQQFTEEIEVPEEAKQAGTMRLDVILYQKGEGTLWYDDVEVQLLP